MFVIRTIEPDWTHEYIICNECGEVRHYDGIDKREWCFKCMSDDVFIDRIVKSIYPVGDWDWDEKMHERKRGKWAGR